MPREASAGAVIFRREKNEVKYLVLHYRYKTDYWDFPKGNIEKGEIEEETVRREVKEETGIEDIEFVFGFKERVSYFYRRGGQTIFKQVTYYLAETKVTDVKISGEHIGYEWVDYQEAMNRLKENSKKVLKKANQFLGSVRSKWV